MSESHVPSGFSPGNLLWAVLAFGAVLIVGLATTSTVKPEVDVEAKRGELRIETRKKIQADETAKLDAVKFSERRGEFVKVLASTKPSASAVKVEAPLLVPAGDSPSLPSAPSGAVNVSFPRLLTPKGAEASLEVVTPAPVQ
ncbi:MAG: hypothetical protein WCL08_08285 [Verrucomicrobiota bacterium]